MFGRRKVPPVGQGAAIPRPPVDSDGKRRVFGEAIFAGEHGDMLRKLGFALDDPANIVPDEAEFDRRVKQSLDRQEQRRRGIEAELLSNHGHNAIRPFFILSEPVYNGALGPWLIRLMNLLPYDDWNVVYLPMDRETQRAMGGGLPLHPRQSIGPVDKLMCDQIGDYHRHYRDAKARVDEHVRTVGITAATEIMGQFGAYTDSLPGKILAHVERVKPKILALIADVQSKAGAA